MDLKDAVLICKNIIPEHICKQLISDMEHWEWSRANWYGYAELNPETGNVIENREGDVKDVQRDGNHYESWGDEKFQQIMREILTISLNKYNENISQFRQSVKMLTTCKVNKYTKGCNIDRHKDHIHSIFDGNKKGIPILSFVGVLNDDYEGGDFIMFDDCQIDLKAGDVIMFPSCFLYPHEVTTITKGTRYSIVSWGF